MMKIIIIFAMLNTYIFDSKLFNNSPKTNVISSLDVGIKPFVVGDNYFVMEIHENFSIENIDGERWMPIKDYEGIYEVSDFGRIKRLPASIDSRNRWNTFKKTLKERIHKGHLNDNKYLRYELSKQGKQKCFFIHRLVASAFVSNPENKPLVCHKDDNPLNNKSDNLFWGTQKDNMEDKCFKNRQAFGVKNANSVLNEEKIIEIRLKVKTQSVKKTALEYGVSDVTIYNILKKKAWGWIK